MKHQTRIDEKLKATMAEIRRVVRDELHQTNLQGLKRYIEDNLSIGMESLENVFKGRKHGRIEEILDCAATYCNALALKQEIDNWQELRSRLNQIRNGRQPGTQLVLRDRKLNKLDLWTPGVSENDIKSRFADSSSPEVIEQLTQYSRSCLAAIADGDFQLQLDISESVISIAKSHEDKLLLGEANYLKAEALRLIADFEDDRTVAKALRYQSIACYETAISTIESDARPVRGRARTIEVLGDLDGALKNFDKAIGLTLSEQPVTQVDRYSILHEQIRSLRHKINCLSAIHKDTTAGTRAHAQQREEIALLLAESTHKHESVLREFRPFGKWWQIEWFMAEVLHARAYISIGETQLAARRLEWAMIQRQAMMQDQGSISRVELGNIQWWAKTAEGARKGFTSAQNAQLQTVLELVGTNASRAIVKSHLERFTNLGQRPWDTK